MLKKTFILIFSFFVLLSVCNSCSMAFDNQYLSHDDYSDYKIMGVVVDAETEDVVKGVSVTLMEAIEVDDEVVMGFKLDSLEVMPDGRFEFYGRSYKGVPDFKYIRVTDQDPEVFGNYQTRVFEVEMSLLDKVSVYSPNIYGVSDLVLGLEQVSVEESIPGRSRE